MARAIEDEYLRKRKLLCAFFPMLLPDRRGLKCFNPHFLQFTSESANQATRTGHLFVDLTPSLEELRRGLDAKWRNKLKRCGEK